jgi:hypothetical protein
MELEVLFKFNAYPASNKCSRKITAVKTPSNQGLKPLGQRGYQGITEGVAAS